MAVFELMMMSPKIREMTFQQASTVDIRKVAKAEGMSTLFIDGIRKVLRGQTTVEEVLRAAREDEE
jgi:type IV pilus assembly protein PilB